MTDLPSPTPNTASTDDSNNSGSNNTPLPHKTFWQNGIDKIRSFFNWLSNSVKLRVFFRYLGVFLLAFAVFPLLNLAEAEINPLSRVILFAFAAFLVLFIFAYELRRSTDQESRV